MSRQQLSYRVCEVFDWRKSDGSLKDMSCRVALLRMHREVLPEKIDDGYHTCPSRRLKTLYPGWDKVLHGPLAADAIGLETLREKSPCVGVWIARLEMLGESSE